MLPLSHFFIPRELQPPERGSQNIRIYCYHGLVHKRLDHRLERNFNLVSDFHEHVRFFRSQSIISPVELAQSLDHRGAVGKNMTVITFDDGYANNLLATKLMAEAKLPCAIFVSTGAIGELKSIWTVELSLLLLHGSSKSFEALGKTWTLETRQSRENAFQAIRYPMKAMPARLRQDIMRGIRAQFPPGETERLLEQFPAFRMLTWPELRQLAEAGVEIGSHGVDHELHHAEQDPEVRRRELIESKQEIERQLGRRCRFFAFPNGDVCESSAQEAEAAGYELAFTTKSDCVRPDSNRFLLPRISPGSSVAKLKQQLSVLC